MLPSITCPPIVLPVLSLTHKCKWESLWRDKVPTRDKISHVVDFEWILVALGCPAILKQRWVRLPTHVTIHPAFNFLAAIYSSIDLSKSWPGHNLMMWERRLFVWASRVVPLYYLIGLRFFFLIVLEGDCALLDFLAIVIYIIIIKEINLIYF